MKTAMKKHSIYIIIAVWGFLLSPAIAQDGAKLFEDNCTTCHTLGTKLVGPDLVGVTQRRDSVWMASFIGNSTAMIQGGDKDAKAIFEEFGKTEMTVFQGVMSEQEIGAVINYLKTAQPAAKEGTPTDTTKSKPPVAIEKSMKAQDIIENAVLATFFGIIVIILFMIMGSISVYLSNAMTEEEKDASFIYKMTAIFHGDWRLFTGKYVESSTEGHEYDGIRELDNIMPPWLQGIFYITIITAIAYMLNYQIINPENTQEKEYQDEMAVAVAKYGNMDVVKIPILQVEDQDKLVVAREIFVSKCAACHQEDGGGGVGPNLTDEYWLHGGSLENIFHTIRNGVPENGMISWKGQVTDEEMLALSSYIRNLKGKTPADPKVPQGEKYVEE